MWNARFLRNAPHKVYPWIASAWIINENAQSRSSSDFNKNANHNKKPTWSMVRPRFVPNVVCCESPRSNISVNEAQQAHFLRKRATLRKAVDTTTPIEGNAEPARSRRLNTSQVLNELRKNQTKMLHRWERDEDGWRELPARAWPAFQPSPEQMEAIREKAQAQGCFESRTTSTGKTSTEDPSNTDTCADLRFQIATTLVFYNVDAAAGLEEFNDLARQGHVDAMVACGIILVEGLGVPAKEREGIAWLERAVKLGSCQAKYELATVYYTGISGVVDEDPEKAYSLFASAAEEQHVASMYMMADCLVEGEGVERDVARAVPLFYAAAELGHRFARQRIRELLASKEYKG